MRPTCEEGRAHRRRVRAVAQLEEHLLCKKREISATLTCIFAGLFASVIDAIRCSSTRSLNALRSTALPLATSPDLPVYLQRYSAGTLAPNARHATSLSLAFAFAPCASEYDRNQGRRAMHQGAPLAYQAIDI
jgi:hypothetical protein